MPTVIPSKGFSSAYRKFIKGNFVHANRVRKAIELIAENVGHPSLNVEKLGGTDLYSARVDRGNRIFFTWKDNSTIVLVDLGSHDKYRRI